MLRPSPARSEHLSVAKRVMREIQLVRDMVFERQLPYIAEGAKSHTEIQTIRRFVAEQNMLLGNLASEKIGDDGTLRSDLDPQRLHTLYFGEYRFDKSGDSRLVCAGGLTVPTRERGLDSLQLHWDDLPEESRASIKKLPLNELAEFRSLVKMPGEPPIVPQLLFRKMLQESLKLGINYWVFGLQPKVARGYQKLFGPCLTELGDRVRLGEFENTYVPLLLDLRQAHDRFLHERRSGLGKKIAGKALERFFLAGAPELETRWVSEGHDVAPTYDSRDENTAV